MYDIQPIPVTILTGFLGAGKTTLLNKLVEQNPLKQLAIIENEFGEISIDSELVVGADEDIFTLSNGCICCSLDGELIEVLLKILNSGKKIDHLLIETTGIADPGPVALNFLKDPKISSMFRLDAIITLVDAALIEQQLENHDEACKQIVIADKILLNKVDNVDSHQLDTAINIIQRLNPEVEVISCSFGNVGEINLLEINAFDGASMKTKFELGQEKVKTRKFSFNRNQIDNTNNLLENGKKSVSHLAIISHSFVFGEPLDILRFDRFIRLILNENTGNIYRIKGILSIADENEKFIIQSVHNQYLVESFGEWGTELRQTKLVFIGKNISKEWIATGLKQCHASDDFEASESTFQRLMQDLQANIQERKPQFA